MGRAPAIAASPTEYEVALDGCAMLRASAGFPEDYIQRFVTDGTNVFATSHSGNVYHRIDDGSVILTHEAPMPGGSSAIALVGDRVVWQSGGPLGQAGMYAAPVGGGEVVRFADPYGGDLVADANAVYFATHQHVCRLAVPTL